MASLPPEVQRAWDNRIGPAILATVSPDGMPNVLYVTCVGKFGEERLLVADNDFDQTRQNVLSGSRSAVLCRSENGHAYQVKGPLEYRSEGEVFDHMKTWNPARHPRHAVAALLIEEVDSGAKRLGCIGRGHQRV